MSELSILFQKEHLSDRIAHGVVARIQGYPNPVDRHAANAQGDDAVFYQEVAVPAAQNEGVRVQVAPGRYRVQAILPTGEILQQDKKVGEGQTAFITFSTPAPREWLSLQGFDGVAPTQTDLERKLSSVNEKKYLVSPFFIGVPITQRLKRMLSLRVRGLPEDDEQLLRFPDIWRGAQQDDAVLLVRQPADTAEVMWSKAAVAQSYAEFVGGWEPVDSPEGPAVTRTQIEGAVSLWQISQVRERWHSQNQRLWAVVDTRDTVEIASLPLPWPSPFDHSTTPLQLLVNNGEVDSMRRISLTVNDSIFSGVLAYLGRGRLAASRPLLDSLNGDELITRTIESKRSNPLAACAAAYVGLAVYEGDDYQVWDPWLRNLKRWFPTIPDGAIIHARRELQRSPTAEHRTQVLQDLKNAYRAGIPYFTAGVLHLRDALVLFAKKDDEAREMLEMVSRVASRIDTAQAFTVLRFAKD